MSASQQQIPGKQGEQPSILSSHVQFVKAQAVDAVGSITGSTEWKQSGHQQKEEAIESMKQASANRDPAAVGYGKAEELAGKISGCEGMEKEGVASAEK